MTAPTVAAPRSAGGTATVATVGGAVEERQIFVCQGVQFRNEDAQPAFSRFPGLLPFDPSMRSGSIVPTDTTGWTPADVARAKKTATTFAGLKQIVFKGSGDRDLTFESPVQGVRFKIKRITSKADFKKALETPGAMVVYDGHARYGRGPCFGTDGKKDDPGDQWENGTGSSPATNTDGIFRMGFPYLSVPMASIQEHGYTAPVVDASTTLNPADCEHDLRIQVQNGNVKGVTLSKITFQKKATDPVFKLQDHCTSKDPTKSYLAYRSVEDGITQWFVVLKAGWTGTVNSPMDLGGINMKCRVFCHFGCETMQHNQPVVRNLAKWTKSGQGTSSDTNFAYFTSNVSDGPTTIYWVHHLLTYSQPNAFGPWAPSLQYAFDNTNKNLKTDGSNYLIV